MLIDEVEITLKAGNGGPGRVSFGKMLKSGPDGGDGGRGGDLYVKAVSDLYALNQFSSVKLKAAQNGEIGGQNQKDGKRGNDLTIELPVGTTLIDQETGEQIDLTEVGQTILVAKGGIGGLGNYDLRSSRNTTPMKAQGGRPGDTRNFKAILKLIADFGLIGLPNAGKSSLLNELTNARAETADYAFTTLEPNLGVLQENKYDENKKILADIPGLIEGASKGKGLGIKFLKHIEKVALLLHCIAADSQDILQDYKTIREELKEFGHGLDQKPEVILLTKTDLVEKDQLKDQMQKLKKLKKKVYAVSIHDFESLESLKKILKDNA
jgi:GTPase